MSYFLSNPESEKLANQVLQGLMKEKAFKHALKNQEIFDAMKEMVAKALQDAETSKNILHDPTFKPIFKRNLLLACTALKLSFVAEHNPKLSMRYNEILAKLDLKLLFKNKEDMTDEEKAEHNKTLREIFTDILNEQNKLLPENQRLNQNQKNKLIDKVMESEDPEEELLKLLDEMADRQRAEELELMSEEEREAQALTEEEEAQEYYEEEKERESARVDGITKNALPVVFTAAIVANPKDYPLLSPVLTKSSIKSEEQVEISNEALQRKKDVTELAIDAFSKVTLKRTH